MKEWLTHVSPITFTLSRTSLMLKNGMSMLNRRKAVTIRSRSTWVRLFQLDCTETDSWSSPTIFTLSQMSLMSRNGMSMLNRRKAVTIRSKSAWVWPFFRPTLQNLTIDPAPAHLPHHRWYVDKNKTEPRQPMVSNGDSLSCVWGRTNVKHSFEIFRASRVSNLISSRKAESRPQTTCHQKVQN